MNGLLMLVALVASKLEEPKSSFIDFIPEKEEKRRRKRRVYKKIPYKPESEFNSFHTD